MPEKLGNGGHGREEYDPNTGKYVADGQPNKVYNNPKENENLSEQQKIRINNLKLFFEFGEMSEEEYNKELQSILYSNENFDKPVDSMTDTELLTEIEKHVSFFEEKGIDLTLFDDAFNYDRKLKCSNYRKLEKLIKKYPIDLEGAEFISDAVHFKNEKIVAGVTTNYAVKKNADGTWEFGVWPAATLYTNPKHFQGFGQVKTDVINGQNKGLFSKTDNNDESISSYFLTHEYGHMIAEKIFYNIINDEIGINEIARKYSQEAEMKWLSSDIKSVMNLKLSYDFNLDDYIRDNIKKGYEKELSLKIIDLMGEISSKGMNESFASDISAYGSTNPSEWFAETFASLECGNPTESAIILGKWLKEKGYMAGD
jgi:hypothetical protein